MNVFITAALCALCTALVAADPPYAPEIDAMRWEILATEPCRIDQATALVPCITNRSFHPVLLPLTPALRRAFSDAGAVLTAGSDRAFEVGVERQLLSFDPTRMRSRGAMGEGAWTSDAAIQLWPDEGYARVYELAAGHVFFAGQHDFGTFDRYWLELDLGDLLRVAFPRDISDDGSWARAPGPFAYGPPVVADLEREARVPVHRSTGRDLFTRGTATRVGELELILIVRDQPADPGRRELFYLVGNRGDQRIVLEQDQLAAATMTPPMHPGQAAGDPWPARDAFGLESGEYLCYRRALVDAPESVSIAIALDIRRGDPAAPVERIQLSADLDLGGEDGLR